MNCTHTHMQIHPDSMWENVYRKTCAFSQLNDVVMTTTFHNISICTARRSVQSIPSRPSLMGQVSHRIHVWYIIYIYANIEGILMGSMLPYIAAPWIRHGYGQVISPKKSMARSRLTPKAPSASCPRRLRPEEVTKPSGSKGQVLIPCREVWTSWPRGGNQIF